MTNFVRQHELINTIRNKTRKKTKQPDGFQHPFILAFLLVHLGEEGTQGLAHLLKITLPSNSLIQNKRIKK